MRLLKTKIIIMSVGLFISSGASAQVVIDEVMYNFGTPDKDESDTGREWVEIKNIGTEDVDLTGWKFDDGATSKHGLNIPPKNGGVGSMVLSPDSFAIFADNAATFLSEHAGFSGTVIDTAMDLGQQKDKTYSFQLIDADGNAISPVSYTIAMGANGDGNSLQKINGTWIASAPTPGAENSAGGNSNAADRQTNQAATSSAAVSSDETAAQTSPSGNTTNWPVDPQMISRIIGPSVAIAGADIALSAEALGLDKKPIENPRYVWNFGDGSVKEGENVLHSYNFPGDYVVILDASSGKFNAESRQKISVVPAELSIGEVVPGSDGRVELLNGSSRELDLSWWRIQSGGNFFTLPKNTKILAHSALPLSSHVLGFLPFLNDTALLYPNGVVAYRFPNKAATVSESESVVLKPVAEKQITAAVSKTAAPVSAIFQSQTAAVAEASPVANGTVAKTAGDSKPQSSPFWFYGVGGVIILGLGFILWPQPNAAESNFSKSGAEEYKIMEE